MPFRNTFFIKYKNIISKTNKMNFCIPKFFLTILTIHRVTRGRRFFPPEPTKIINLFFRSRDKYPFLNWGNHVCALYRIIRDCTHLKKKILNLFCMQKKFTFFLQFSFLYLIYSLGRYNRNKNQP